MDYESHKIKDDLKSIAAYSGHHTKPLKFSVLFPVGNFGFKSWKATKKTALQGIIYRLNKVTRTL